jgi:ribose transport system substrate-binding protein
MTHKRMKTGLLSGRGMCTGLLIPAVAALAVGCGSTATHTATTAAAKTPENSNSPIGVVGTKSVYTTVGPTGQAAVPATAVQLTAAEAAALKKRNYTAAIAMHLPAAFTSAVVAGASAEFAKLGIRLVASTDANGSATTQVNQLQTIQAKHPNAVISIPFSPTTEASAYKALSASGTKLVLLSNVPTGMQYPSQYAGIVTDDLANMGKQAAILLGTAMHGAGNAAMIYYDTAYYVTNERDAAFRSWLGKLYPNIHLVAQEGFADPTTVQTVASAMLERNPNLKGIYVSFSTPPTDGVLAALRTVGTDTQVKVVTDDLDPSIDAGLCNGQYLAGVVADQPYLLGETLAKEAGLAILGKHVPSFSVVKAIAVTKSNLLNAWRASLNQAPPTAIANACHK